MHCHVWGSYHAKFDDDVFNSFRGIACEGHIHTRTWGLSTLKLAKSVWRSFKNTAPKLWNNLPDSIWKVESAEGFIYMPTEDPSLFRILTSFSLARSFCKVPWACFENMEFTCLCFVPSCCASSSGDRKHTHGNHQKCCQIVQHIVNQSVWRDAKSKTLLTKFELKTSSNIDDCHCQVTIYNTQHKEYILSIFSIPETKNNNHLSSMAIPYDVPCLFSTADSIWSNRYFVCSFFCCICLRFRTNLKVDNKTSVWLKTLALPMTNASISGTADSSHSRCAFCLVHLQITAALFWCMNVMFDQRCIACFKDQ